MIDFEMSIQGMGFRQVMTTEYPDSISAYRNESVCPGFVKEQR